MQKPATIAPRCITMAIGPSGCCETTHGEPESRSREDARAATADSRGSWAWCELPGARLAPPAFICVTGDAEPPGFGRSDAAVSMCTSGHLYGESAFSAATTKVRVSVEMGGAETSCSGGVLKAQHVEWVVSNFGGLWD